MDRPTNKVKCTFFQYAVGFASRISLNFSAKRVRSVLIDACFGQCGRVCNGDVTANSSKEDWVGYDIYVGSFWVSVLSKFLLIPSSSKYPLVFQFSRRCLGKHCLNFCNGSCTRQIEGTLQHSVSQKVNVGVSETGNADQSMKVNRIG